MKELELLGLQPDGETLTLNDAEGNRYVLPITDDLRAALRRDRTPSAETPPRPMSVPEIQAYVRGGMSIDEVCEISALPAARIEALAHPIIVEREYQARQARGFSIGHDAGALTLEELVASRLLSRGVSPSDITWDAVRKENGWMLIASFVTGHREHQATWRVDFTRHTLEALDDEGSWLSETQLPISGGTWRAANTPPADIELPARAAEAPTEEVTAVESMLASLDSQRGQSRPMPTEDNDVATDFEGAHPAASEPDEAKDATILALPKRPLESVSDPEPAEEEPKAEEPVEAPEQPALIEVKPEPAATRPKKKRPARPSMPSWDEIVFGKKD